MTLSDVERLCAIAADAAVAETSRSRGTKRIEASRVFGGSMVSDDMRNVESEVFSDL